MWAKTIKTFPIEQVQHFNYQEKCFQKHKAITFYIICIGKNITNKVTARQILKPQKKPVEANLSDNHQSLKST
jgi:hypothetical protein